jgi:putative Ca2+/H+ antiporter (TMEM165/GDT1 family)
MFFQALFVSTAVVAVGEIGDKTQLLALMLAARFRRPWVGNWCVPPCRPTY